MRCHCRPLRLYSLLLVGIVFGFMLSNIVRNLSLFSGSPVLSQKDSRQLQRTLDYTELTKANEAGRVRFANLQQGVEGDSVNIDLGGDYVEDDESREIIDYPRAKPQIESPNQVKRKNEETKTIEDEGDQPNELDEAVNPHIQDLEGDDAVTDSMDDQDDTRKKQDSYLETNWQGRSMQDIHAAKAPIHKLSDELAVRKSLLIAIITSVQQLMSQTIAIHGTWANEATKVIYFTGEVETMPHLPHGMDLRQLEGIDDKQANYEIKEFAVIKYLLRNYGEEVDWFLIVGDDVYVNPKTMEKKLIEFNASFQVYMGHTMEGENHLKCDAGPGVVYSRGLLNRLEAYLPQCQGESISFGDCIIKRGISCTQAKETHELFFLDHKHIVETHALFSSKEITRALTVYPVRYPKFMYRLNSYFLESSYNTSLDVVRSTMDRIKDTHPFVPTHLRSPFHPTADSSEWKNTDTGTLQPQVTPQSANNVVVVRPRHIPKNKFELNYWEYFNQTRLMSVNHEQPSRGIIGGIREEARYALTKAIYLVNQGLPHTQRLVFEKLDNGYHRVDPMRGSEYILDFVFRKNSDRSVRVKKRMSILRPFHDAVVPVDTPEQTPKVNFVVTLSGLSNRLEQFLANYEKNILQPGEDATLTVVLFNGPDAPKVHSLMDKYSMRYPSSKISIVDTEGKFARGVGLHRGTEAFKDNDLLFFVDVDLEISSQFLQRCRLNTVRGKQVYFPVFFKLYNLDFVHKYYKANSSQLLSRHYGHWAHYSYGMVCIYASDYKRSSGFNLDMKGWGEEDVDLLNKVMNHGIEVFRAPDPGLIHLWHRKVCDKDSVITADAYRHCLQSKAENLADRIELAQYVFDNELNHGTVL